MKTLIQASCEAIISELRHKTYTEQRYRQRGIRNPTFEIDFDILDLPSKYDPNSTPHLVAIDRVSGSYLYLAEVRGQTGYWIVDDSSFFERTHKFGDICLDLLEGKTKNQNYSQSQIGQILLLIAKQLFNETMSQ